ncbi:hypothetical protein CH63R_02362 [Colletotrichum higginsianum IMI 349063]|uniref:Uncharacterized protein n=2 Tax=Colletotrichum higginsianum TaxID=80884 RepID=A0A1B7YNJ7_COLHI|nr:hypothetical protein CH63R_02362 [Colletotrichum higginsianum IMI 349063]OBR13636.1 hypothetical protein CH63R_02362 [Colletotrichum higginsianum IMI 349063]TID02427.1 hypothetical protein CH35J_003847 [Colletotrichum higginsianum]
MWFMLLFGGSAAIADKAVTAMMLGDGKVQFQLPSPADELNKPKSSKSEMDFSARRHSKESEMPRNPHPQ